MFMGSLNELLIQGLRGSRLPLIGGTDMPPINRIDISLAPARYLFTSEFRGHPMLEGGIRAFLQQNHDNTIGSPIFWPSYHNYDLASARPSSFFTSLLHAYTVPLPLPLCLISTSLTIEDSLGPSTSSQLIPTLNELIVMRSTMP